MKRREFLKLTGLSGALALSGCGQDSVQKLIPFLNPPEDLVPGIASWYATTCRQCPAGCGLLARNREGRIVKLEGNPYHPVNQGKLCARGQAGLQELYSPDRIAAPELRENQTSLRTNWNDALSRLHHQATAAEGRIAVISGLESGFASGVLYDWLMRYKGGRIAYYEPINYEAVRQGNRVVFDQDVLPYYDLHDCDLIVSAGVDFLETWLSPVELTRQFIAARDPDKNKAGFVYAGPRMSMTAASADRWIALRPQGESAFLYAVLIELLRIHPAEDLVPADKAKIAGVVQGLFAKDLAADAGVSHEQISALALRIIKANKTLVLTDGSTDAVVAANLINALTGSAPQCVHFGGPHALSSAATGSDMQDLIDRVAAGEFPMLVIHKSNPLFSLPGMEQAMAKAKFVVAIDSTVSETTERANLVLPIHTPFESWGWYVSRPGVIGMIQPAMGPVVDSRPLESILAPQDASFNPDALYTAFAAAAVQQLKLPFAALSAGFLELQARGFIGPWLEKAYKPEVEPDKPPKPPPMKKPVDKQETLNLKGYTYKPAAPAVGTTLIAYPSLRWYDGRDANKNWMLEIPDPMTNITWDAWLEIHPETARARGIAEGDRVELVSASGRATLPVHLYPGLHPDAIAAPIGLGHNHSGLYATGPNANVLAVTGLAFAAQNVAINKTGDRQDLAHTDGSKSQHGRQIARAVYENPHHKPEAHGHHPHFPIRIPIASEHDPQSSVYPPVEHVEYRWGMVIDLDRCTGCSACVAACYAENNVATVGRQRILEGREMSWIHIERYIEDHENPGIRFIPMLCQHCDSAPCEAVCPVYAAHHNKEGLNEQVYNRCVGTRYCSQNCPYKVRRFNFYRYNRKAPQAMQLNPDVTVRQLGVMEKCSFCVQRIKAAHQTAKVEDRKIREGDVMPACAQTCPADAISFGSYMDSESTVLALARSDRAYQVLDELNTRPGVIYLKKIIRDPRLEKA